MSPPSPTSHQQFERTFQAWIDRQPWSSTRPLAQASSIESYRVLWDALTRWCLRQVPPVALDALDEAALLRFLASRDDRLLQRQRRPEHVGQTAVSARHAWRVLHLVDNVLLCHASQHRSLDANRCAERLLQSREDWLYANATRRDPPPDYLPAAEARALVSHLVGPRPGADRVTILPWQAWRNRAAVALHLGAGLTPAEVRGLTVAALRPSPADQARGATADTGPATATSVPWKVVVPALDNSPERIAPVMGWAGRVLAQWLAERERQGIAGVQLLPSTRSGKPWSKVSHWQAVNLVLSESGVDPELIDGGSFRLRHTFALRQLRRGIPAEQVALWLGVVEMRVIDRYRRLLEGGLG